MLALMAFISRYKMSANRHHAYGQRVECGEVVSSRPAASTFRAYSAACRRYLLPQGFKGLFPYMTRFQVLFFFLLIVYAILFSLVGIAYKVWVDPTGPPGKRVGFNEFVGDRTGVLSWVDDTDESINTFITTRLSSVCIYSTCLLIIVPGQYLLPHHWNPVPGFQLPPQMGGLLDLCL